jgi:hypothetical protein
VLKVQIALAPKLGLDDIEGEHGAPGQGRLKGFVIVKAQIALEPKDREHGKSSLLSDAPATAVACHGALAQPRNDDTQQR